MTSGNGARERLSQRTLTGLPVRVRRPAYDRSKIPIGIVHIGPGAFHRAHQAVYVDDILAEDPRWGISAVSLKNRATRDALAPQDGLYALSILDDHPSLRVIGSIRELLVAPEGPRHVLDRLAHPGVRVVTITVTEKGYELDGAGNLDLASPAVRADLAAPRAPQSLAGFLVEGLRLRREAGMPALTIISCDNLPDNGERLRRAVVAFAREHDRGLAAWIDAETRFPRTMVDSITPATDDALRVRVSDALGLWDAWPVQREAFHQWVIEDTLVPGGPDWAGVGATLTRDVGAHERAKLRLLNGAHSTLAYIGLLRGHATVFDAVMDQSLADFVGDLLTKDVVPALAASPGIDLDSYIQAIFRRFRNRAIRHNLAQIAWDGSQKIPIRILATLNDAVRAGRPIGRLCVPVAAWMQFVRRAALEGRAIIDPMAEQLIAIGTRCTGKAKIDVPMFLALEPMFGELARVPAFTQGVEVAYTILGGGTPAERSFEMPLPQALYGTPDA
ncbi:MAG: mannitol dehydrogenase family protein [Alphaproteobacteria bacterium]